MNYHTLFRQAIALKHHLSAALLSVLPHFLPAGVSLTRARLLTSAAAASGVITAASLVQATHGYEAYAQSTTSAGSSYGTGYQIQESGTSKTGGSKQSASNKGAAAGSLAPTATSTTASTTGTGTATGTTSAGAGSTGASTRPVAGARRYIQIPSAHQHQDDLVLRRRTSQRRQ
jgi:hypothetical protein